MRPLAARIYFDGLFQTRRERCVVLSLLLVTFLAVSYARSLTLLIGKLGLVKSSVNGGHGRAVLKRFANANLDAGARQILSSRSELLMLLFE